MRVWGALQGAALLASVLWATPLLAKKEHPNIEVTAFDQQPRNLNYFQDSDVVLFQDISENNVYRSDDGGVKWKQVDDVKDGAAWFLFMHEFDSERAYIITQGTKHYRTHDRGKSWTVFETKAEMSMYRADILQFHADDPDRIIFNGLICQSIIDCHEVAMYTTDGFKTPAKLLRGDTNGCWWAKSSVLFSTGSKDLDNDRILCITMGDSSARVSNQRLLISDDFFKSSGNDIQEFEPNLDTNKPVHGVVNVAVVKKYLLVATTSSNTNEMALFVTDDTKKWHRAVFPSAHDSHDHRLMQEAYTVLESTNYSIQIDVMTTHPSNPMGVLLTSNSNGTYFTENTEHTNRSPNGHVDFEKIAGIQGIFLINKVDNWKDVEKDPKTAKKIVTEITFDDGRTFEKVTADGKRIHLHSVTELSNLGRVFSSPAPGLVMAIGNTGDALGDYFNDGNLYVSDDAGKTWSKAPLDGPHKYEFGDQGSILLAVKDSQKEDIDEFSYSLNHGVDWVTESLPKGLKIRPYILTTTQDSTSLKFILIGKSKDKKPWQVISIDFEGLHEDTCKDSDMEEWSARVDKDGKPTCLMGHTQSYRRRKKKAECFLKQEFKHIEMETKDCDCTDLDYECDYNFVRDDDGKCIKRGPIIAPEGACPAGKPDATFKGTSGYRKIPGDTCKSTKETDEKYKEVEQKCSEVIDAPSAPATGLISQTKKSFGEWAEFEKYYLPRGESSTSNDETIIMRPFTANKAKAGSIWITHDHGKKWEEIKELKDEKVVEIIPHDYFKDMVFFVLTGKKVIYTLDRGHRYHEFEVQAEKHPEDPYPLKFHPDKMDWLLWEGLKCDGDECYRIVSYSTDRGDNWNTGARYIERCEFTGSSEYTLKYRGREPEQIICVKHSKENNEKDTPWVLATTDDWFKKEEIREKNVKNFATMSEFIVVATEDKKEETLRAHASLDGVNYAEVKFPFNFDVVHQHGYTVLQSSTHAVNLFVAEELDDNNCISGTIIKSNSNGTSYVVSARNVNCNPGFFVDFEKMQGLEGVVLINTIANPGKGSKKLQTKISHNDGAEWDYLPSPAKDDEFGKFPCHSSASDKCALHLHGYTERRDRSKTYSTETAIGVLLGWGNVGDSLGDMKDADTFMSTDAGISWKRVKKGRWNWAIGDQGSILVLVQTTPAVKETDVLFYSLDLGETWEEYKFSETGKVEVTDISTQQSGNSQNFIIWGHDDDALFTLNLDFSGFSERVCKHDDDLSKSDYTIFSPQHPKQPNGCLFGHKSEYLRKKAGAKCVNDFTLPQIYTNTNCTCTRQDYECDYNFELDSHGQCKLVQGHAPLDAATWCKAHPDVVEYYEPTGYRRVPLTTCVDGQELDKVGIPVACEGHREEFERKHRTSGLAIFFAIVIPIAAAAAVGWYVYRNWNGKFGAIRLGEQGSSAFDSDKPWVKYPVIALSAVVAVVVALPVVVGSIWRFGKGVAERFGIGGGGSRGGWSSLSNGGRTARYTTRDSFARGRGDYAAVDDDEGELLGDDSDEDV
ncbi:hypothetical protein V8F06_002133 [Rhypophila decipiens]